MFSLVKRLHNPFLWSFIEVLIKRGGDFLVKLYLTKILFPEDFGILGMAVVFSSLILVLSELGMLQALIQRDEASLTNTHFHTAFWTMQVWSIFLFVVSIYVVAPIIASFNSIPILEKVFPILCVPILFSAFNVVNKSKLMRSIAFKKIAFINITSTFIAAIIAVSMAFYGMGIWSLVIYTAIPLIISFPLYAFVTRWYPKFVWSKKSFLELALFSKYMILTHIIVNVNSNIDYFILGKFGGAKELGIYTIAYMITILMVFQFTSMINRVLFPFFSKLQGDIIKLKSKYISLLELYVLVILPFAMILFLFSDSIVTLLFGVKWEESSALVKLLSIVTLLQVFYNSCGIIYRSLGRPKIEMNILLLIFVFITLPSIIIGSIYYGSLGVVYALILSAICNLFLNSFYLNKFLKISLLELLSNTRQVFLMAGSCFFLIYLLEINFEFNFLILVSLFFVLYGFSILLFYKNKIKLFKKEFNVF